MLYNFHVTASNKNKRRIINITSETKNIILTILAPTSIFLFAQAGKPDQVSPSSTFSAILTSDSYVILIFAVWSLIFSIGGWHIFVDKKTFGLKKTVAKNAFAVYIMFLASIILSLTFLCSVLSNIRM